MVHTYVCVCIFPAHARPKCVIHQGRVYTMHVHVSVHVLNMYTHICKSVRISTSTYTNTHTQVWREAAPHASDTCLTKSVVTMSKLLSSLHLLICGIRWVTAAHHRISDVENKPWMYPLCTGAGIQYVENHGSFFNVLWIRLGNISYTLEFRKRRQSEGHAAWNCSTLKLLPELDPLFSKRSLNKHHTELPLFTTDHMRSWDKP